MPGPPEQELRELVSKYLLITDDSLGGQELLRRVLAEYNLRKLTRTVFLKGDYFFSKKIQRLLEVWGIETRCEGQKERPGDQSLYVHPPVERRQDIPLVVSYIVQRYLEDMSSDQPFTPRYLCAETILMLLTSTLWHGFDHLESFLHIVLQADWRFADNTVMALPARELASDTFEETARVLRSKREDLGIGFGRSPWAPKVPITKRYEDKELVRSELLFGEEPKSVLELESPALEYAFTNPSAHNCIVYPFPLSSIKQAMENMSSHLDGRQRSEDEMAVIKRISNHRFQQCEKSRNIQRAKRDLNTTVWHGWDMDQEIEFLCGQGLCSADTYQSVLEKLNMNLNFPNQDTTLDEWRQAESTLFESSYTRSKQAPVEPPRVPLSGPEHTILPSRIIRSWSAALKVTTTCLNSAYRENLAGGNWTTALSIWSMSRAVGQARVGLSSSLALTTAVCSRCQRG